MFCFQVKEGISIPLGYDGDSLLEWLYVVLWFANDPWRLATLSFTRTCYGRCRRLRGARPRLPEVSTAFHCAHSLKWSKFDQLLWFIHTDADRDKYREVSEN